MKKLDYIDALRGLAILGVIMVHSISDSNLPFIVERIFGQGARGVQLFYLASAFTLFLSFSNRIDKENNPIRNFFLRRFFRIAPIYYLGIVYYLFQDGIGERYWLGDEKSISIFNILSNFTFTHGFSPYFINSLVPGGWSIAVEMLFYCILPLLFLKIKNINQAFNFFLFSIILKLLLHLILFKLPIIDSASLWSEYLFLYFPSQLPVFSLGILLYFVIIQNQKLSELSGKSLLLFSGLLILELATGKHIILPNHILYGLAFFLFALGLSRFHLTLIINPIITYIGKLSFSMYISHFAVIFWLTKWNYINFFANEILNYISKFFLVTTVTVFIASILYKIIEIPFQNFSKKIITNMENKSIEIINSKK